MQFIMGSQFGIDSTTLGEISCFSNPDHYYRRMWYAMQFDSIMAADANMDTSLSPDSADSRKRHLESEQENACVKKTYHNANGDADISVYHLKLLIPCVVAGAIIGKGGETIAQLQREKRAKVKMSKANDFYPGTTERVCIISSNSPESIMSVLIFVMEKIREKPELPKLVVSEINSEREKQVKILVPNTTAGMIIGKGGSFIKLIKEQTGAYVQLSQKPKDISLPERCITISGDIETNTKVCEMILQKIIEDPQSGSCPNLSYADVTGPVANFSPTGSPFAAAKSAVINGAHANSTSANGLVNSSLNLCLNMPNTMNNVDTAVVAKILENLNMALCTSGFSEIATNEIITALTILTRYGMIGVGFGQQNNNGMPQQATKPTNNTVDISALTAANGLFNTSGTPTVTPNNSFDLSTAATALDIFHPSQLNLTNNNCLGLLSGNEILTDVTAAAVAAAVADIKKIDLEVTDGILAAILGPAGRSLLDIQYRSGAIIQISKKNIFNSVNPTNRLISISGTSAAITAAQFLIEQKVAESISKAVSRQNINISSE